MTLHGHARVQGTSEFLLSSPEELARRLAWAPAEDRVRGYLFESTLEQVRLRGSAEAVRRCIEASGVEAPTAFFKYPFASLLRMIYQAAWELMGSASFEDTLRDLGRHVCQYFLENLVGRSFLAMVGRNPRQLTEALPAAYRTAWEHGWVSLRWMGPQHCVATHHGGVIPPPYVEGMILRLYEATGAVRPRVVSRTVELGETEYEISWG